MLRVLLLAPAITAAKGLGLELAQLDELLDFLAALDDFERLLAAHLLGLHAQEVAARTHARKEPCALHALLEAADKVYRTFPFVLRYFRVYHMPQNYSTPFLKPQLADCVPALLPALFDLGGRTGLSLVERAFFCKSEGRNNYQG